jgi:pimeloyl-ACP methyl ester carboxylesterase
MGNSSHTLSRRDLLASLTALGTAASLTFVNARGVAAENAGTTIRPFRIAIPQEQLDDLRRRLALTRWPDREPVGDASQGVPLERMKALIKHWHDRYDWRRVEARLNTYPQFVTTIDDIDIHFLHVRSQHATATPLIMTHGWPGSIIEFVKVIDALTNPTAHGGRSEDAFHLVLPSLPGYGFSGKPTATGWDRHRIARAWHTLMTRLGYERYFAQGGDWGAVVTQAMGHQAPTGLAGIHINMPAVVPKELPAQLSADEQRALDALNVFFTKGAGYAQIQATRPQTLGYALADSPGGQAAWIYEKFMIWSDSGGNVESVLSMDEMLDDISLYWLTDSATSSARLYWENADLAFYAVEIDVPVGVTVFPGEIYRAPKTWAQQCYHRLVYWSEAPKGGHFAAFEQPEIFAREVRAAFAAMRAR